jgi:predicted transcriptional regulator
MDEIAQALGVNKSVVHYRLQRLIDAGLLVGTTKHYTLPELWALCQQL